jgi:hypothetical protein
VVEARLTALEVPMRGVAEDGRVREDRGSGGDFIADGCAGSLMQALRGADKHTYPAASAGSLNSFPLWLDD